VNETSNVKRCTTAFSKKQTVDISIVAAFYWVRNGYIGLTSSCFVLFVRT